MTALNFYKTHYKFIDWRIKKNKIKQDQYLNYSALNSASYENLQADVTSDQTQTRSLSRLLWNSNHCILTL